MSTVFRPSVLWPDVEAWAIGYLSTALAAREESYAEDVAVRKDVGDTMPARLVTVRDDGGGRTEVTRSSGLGVNVWASTDEDCSDLARLVCALLEASAGYGPVVACTGSYGPYPVPEESGKPHRYLSVDLIVTGVPLTTV